MARRAILVDSSPMRSRSITDLEMLMISRRSEAAGCRRARMRRHSSSMLRSIWLICSSTSRTCWARPESASISAVTASLTCFSTSPPMASRWLRTSSSSALNCCEM